jgi:hypothetical protein
MRNRKKDLQSKMGVRARSLNLLGFRHFLWRIKTLQKVATIGRSAHMELVSFVRARVDPVRPAAHAQFDIKRAYATSDRRPPPLETTIRCGPATIAKRLALIKTGGDCAAASQMIGKSQATVYRWVKAFGLTDLLQRPRE